MILDQQTKQIIVTMISYPAVVAWSVRVSGNNTGPWQAGVRIPLRTHDLYGTVAVFIIYNNNWQHGSAISHSLFDVSSIIF